MKDKCSIRKIEYLLRTLSVIQIQLIRQFVTRMGILEGRRRLYNKTLFSIFYASLPFLQDLSQIYTFHLKSTIQSNNKSSLHASLIVVEFLFLFIDIEWSFPKGQPRVLYPRMVPHTRCFLCCHGESRRMFFQEVFYFTSGALNLEISNFFRNLKMRFIFIFLSYFTQAFMALSC